MLPIVLSSSDDSKIEAKDTKSKLFKGMFGVFLNVVGRQFERSLVETDQHILNLVAGSLLHLRTDLLNQSFSHCRMYLVPLQRK